MREIKKRCPFCNGKPATDIREAKSRYGKIWEAVATCDGCGMKMTTVGRTRDEARDMLNRLWNTRYEQTCRPIWKQSKQQGILIDTCECSECGRCLDDLGVGIDGGVFPYCPYCGAKVVDV